MPTRQQKEHKNDNFKNTSFLFSNKINFDLSKFDFTVLNS